MIDLLLHHAVVITMNPTRDILENGAVAVDGGRILEVGDSAALQKKYQAQKTIDCKGDILMPGLINCHTHAGHNIMGKLSTDSIRFWCEAVNRIYEHGSDYDFWYADGQLAALKFLRSGVTTAMSILGSSPMSDDPELARGQADGYTSTGAREVLGCGVVCGGFPHKYTRKRGNEWVKVNASVDDMIAGTEEILRQNHRAHGGLCRVFVTPFLQLASPPAGVSDPVSLARLTPLDREVNAKSRALAKKYGTNLNTDTYGGWITLAYTDKENMLLGPDVLVGLEHAMGITPEEVNILAETDTRVYCTGEGFYKRAPLSEMLQKGITVAATTNGSAPRNMVDLLEAVRKLITIEIVAHDDYHYLQAGKALEMITIDAARALGWDDEIGSLEAGKRADLSLLDWHKPHLTPQTMPVQKVIYSAVGSDFKTVIVDGKVVMEDYVILTVDEGEVLRRAQEMHEAVVERAGLQACRNQVTWGRTRIAFSPDDPILSWC